MKRLPSFFLALLILVSYGCFPIPTATPTLPPTETLTPPASFTVTPNLTESTTPEVQLTETLTPTESFTPLPTSTETTTPTTSITPSLTSSPVPLTIPSQGDWEAGTLAFTHGAEGEWDHILWGGFAHSLIKKGSTYYLYYQGSRFYDTQCESVAYRSIGVATSSDGISWTKYAGNPVISWSSQGSIEEGATSSAAWLGADGKIYLYYGANTGTGCHVTANARLAVSDDGLHFQDVGEVLSASDPGVWGSGDEIFPLGAFVNENQWTLYYTPNGVPLSRKLGAALGGSPNTFNRSLGVNNETVSVWGPVSAIPGGVQSVLVVNPDTSPPGVIDFYRFDAANPVQIGLHTSYTLPNCNQASVIYEESLRRWMMSCLDQNWENYNIRTAFPP